MDVGLDSAILKKRVFVQFLSLSLSLHLRAQPNIFPEPARLSWTGVCWPLNTMSAVIGDKGVVSSPESRGCNMWYVRAALGVPPPRFTGAFFRVAGCIWRGGVEVFFVYGARLH